MCRCCPSCPTSCSTSWPGKKEVKFAAGEWIFHEGEPAESMFIIRSGRAEVISEGPPEMVIRVLRRGELLGELALLRQAPRSASVRARRDTELLELGREASSN